MPSFKDIIVFFGIVVATKFIEAHLPSLHYTNIVAGAKKLWAYTLAFIFLLLVRMRIIKLSNITLLVLIVIGVLYLVLEKFKEEQKKLKPVTA